MSSSLQQPPAAHDVPWNEQTRLAALDQYQILDTPTEPEFDDIVRLAADTFGAPISVVNLIASGRQWFKAEVGIGARELPLDVSICAHAILQTDTMVVPDTRLDPRFASNPLVTPDGGLRFYAGALLKTAEGLPIGTVCVLDREPRPEGITPHQRLTLEVLARQVMTQLELRRIIRQQATRAAELELEIRERETAEAARRESDGRYRSLFNSLDAGFCVLQLAFDAAGQPTDYKFVEINDAFAKQTGLTDARGKWMKTLHPGHEQHWFDVYGKVAKTGEPARFENVAESLDRRWYDVHAFRIDGVSGHVAVLFNDITDRRRSEMALRELNETLDRRVTAAIAAREESQEALRQSQKLEAVGQLTGGVAHDFNNLLTVIRGSVELLRRPGLADDKRKRYIDAIGDTADRAARLTAQLLTFARRQTLKPEAFDSGASVLEVASIVRALLGSQVTLETDVPKVACFITADRSQFDTAIVNMSINARDAMNGEGHLSILARPVTGIPAIRSHGPVAGEFVAITISDTGSGITAEDRVRIFEPFFTTKALGQGTGLGLSQVIGFAKQSGGDIRVESEVGIGTTFTLYLPRTEAGAIVAPAVTEPQQVEGREEVCVLVVEDNAEVGAFATEALRELGYSSIRAPDARRALEHLATDGGRFHVVFSDVVMPGMNGQALGREIHRLYPDIPVILTSGYSHVLVQEGAGEFELLQKPYSIEQLSRAIRKALKAEVVAFN
jgi:PAS domain S-box-containing protein